MSAALSNRAGVERSDDLLHRFYRELFCTAESCRNLPGDLEYASLHRHACAFFEAGGLFIPPSPTLQGGRHLFASSEGEVTAAAFELSALYGKPIREFTRVWLICGAHVLFVVDRIRSLRPVRVCWRWLLENHGPPLDLKLVPPDRLVARRGMAGMKLFHLGSGELQESLPVPANDVLHPHPTDKPDRGTPIHWMEDGAATERTVVHALALDDPGTVAGWHLRQEEGFAAVLEAPSRARKWKLALAEGEVSLADTASGRVSAWNLPSKS